MASLGLGNSILREIKRLTGRKIYIFAMVLVPLACAAFFLGLMHKGLPLKVPSAVVDLDNSSVSRSIVRELAATELIDLRQNLNSYNEALQQLREGNVIGFFIIPADFEKKALSGRTPSITYYSNMSYYVPGTLAFKGFKTVAVSSSAGIAATSLVGMGADPGQVETLLQPVTFQDHPIGNPWTNYSIYLGNSFIPGVLALMILLVTVFTVCLEIKDGTSNKWLETAHGSVFMAVTGKLLPQTVVFSVVGIFIQSLLFGYCSFPLSGSPWALMAAMVLMVVACQAFALFFCCVLPNLRLALSVVSLIGVLSFSITGFSFPVESMYPSMAIFSYAVPLRYYFLIYVDQALNGIPLYYSRLYYVALILFPLISSTMLWRLKRACLHPVYVP